MHMHVTSRTHATYHGTVTWLILFVWFFFLYIYILKKAGEENTIWKIDLGFNKIGDDGVIAIAKLLESGFSKVEWLNLHGNDAIGFEGMKALSRAVAQDQVLGSIDLGNNVRMTVCNAVCNAVHGSIRYTIYNM